MTAEAQIKNKGYGRAVHILFLLFDITSKKIYDLNMAVTIKIKKTGELKQVTRNEAFDLIDRGLAKRVYENEAKPVKQEPTGYPMQDLGAGSENRHNPYSTRQLRPKVK